MRPIWRRALLALVLIVAFWSTAAFAQRTVAVEHWMRGDQGMYNVIQAAIDEYEAITPHVDVTLTPFTAAESEERFLAAMATNIQVDVIRTNPEVNLRAYAKSGLILPLDDLAAQVGLDLENFYPEALELARVDGKLYAIPYTVVPIGGLFYRTDYFDAAGLAYPDASWRWEHEFIEAAERLRVIGPGGETTRFPIQLQASRLQGSFDARPLTLDMTESNALSEANFRFFQFLQELGERGFVGGNFGEGTAAMGLSGGYWQKAAYDAAGIGGLYAVAPVPQGPAGRRIDWVVGSYSIPKTSADPVEAMRYIAHLVSPKWSAAWVRAGLNPSPRHEVNMMEEFLDDPIHLAWGEFFAYPAEPFPWPPNLRFTETRDAWNKAINSVLSGESDIGNALNTLDQALKAILADDMLI